MAWITLDPLAFDLGDGYFPHEETCLCDFCLPWNTCEHFHGGDCEHTYDPAGEQYTDEEIAAYEAAAGIQHEAAYVAAQPVLSGVADGYDDLPFD